MIKKWLYILIVLIIPGCNTNAELPIATYTPIDTYESPIIITSPSAISTVTPMVLVTNTPKAYPTLSEQGAKEFSEKLMTEDLCSLPCWAGIEPGITTWVETEARLSTFAHIGKTNQWGMWSVCFPESSRNRVCSKIQHDNNKVIRFIWTFRENYVLEKMLITYGEPEEIFVGSVLDWAENPWIYRYYLVLFYPQHGFMATYHGTDKVMASEFNVCLSNIVESGLTPDILIWSKNADIKFSEVAKNYLDQYLNIDQFKPLRQVSDFDTGSFFTIFTSNNSDKDCIQVLSSYEIEK